MPSCIVCHLTINESTDTHYECNNGHSVHRYCLAEWLMHSHNCPLCNDLYPENLIAQFKDYKEKKEQEKQAVLDKQLQKESMKKMEEVTSKIVFLKLIESIENLIQEENYNEAINQLLDSYNESAVDIPDLISHVASNAEISKAKAEMAKKMKESLSGLNLPGF